MIHIPSGRESKSVSNTGAGTVTIWTPGTGKSIVVLERQLSISSGGRLCLFYDTDEAGKRIFDLTMESAFGTDRELEYPWQLPPGAVLKALNSAGNMYGLVSGVEV